MPGDISAIQSAQQPPSGDQNANIMAQLLGDTGPKTGDSGIAGAMSQTLDKAQLASAQMLDSNAKIDSSYQVARDPQAQQAADAKTVSAGFTPGNQVADLTQATTQDTSANFQQIADKKYGF